MVNWLRADFDEWLRTAGGEGSGNFGHAGRPGEQGGSASGPGGVDRRKSQYGLQKFPQYGGEGQYPVVVTRAPFLNRRKAAYTYTNDPLEKVKDIDEKRGVRPEDLGVTKAGLERMINEGIGRHDPGLTQLLHSIPRSERREWLRKQRLERPKGTGVGMRSHWTG